MRKEREENIEYIITKIRKERLNLNIGFITIDIIQYLDEDIPVIEALGYKIIRSSFGYEHYNYIIYDSLLFDKLENELIDIKRNKLKEIEEIEKSRTFKYIDLLKVINLTKKYEHATDEQIINKMLNEI